MANGSKTGGINKNSSGGGEWKPESVSTSAAKKSVTIAGTTYKLTGVSYKNVDNTVAYRYTYSSSKGAKTFSDAAAEKLGLI